MGIISIVFRNGLFFSYNITFRRSCFCLFCTKPPSSAVPCPPKSINTPKYCSSADIADSSGHKYNICNTVRGIQYKGKRRSGVSREYDGDVTYAKTGR